MLRVTVAAGAALQGLAFALQKLRCNHISNSTKAGHQNQARARAVNILVAIPPHFQETLGPIADPVPLFSRESTETNKSNIKI
jgi:hypothetical protein